MRGAGRGNKKTGTAIGVDGGCAPRCASAASAGPGPWAACPRPSLSLVVYEVVYCVLVFCVLCTVFCFLCSWCHRFENENF